jgi:hypothetical protein
MKRTTDTPKPVPRFDVAYWAAAVTLAVLGLMTLFGAFGSSEFAKILSYILIGIAVVLYTARWIVLRRRARSRK